MKRQLLRETTTRLALEPRIVFDAAIAATTTEVDAKVSPVTVAADRSEAARTNVPVADARAQGDGGAVVSAPSQLIFIDAGAQGVEPFLNRVEGEVIHLNPNRDGVQQILDALAGRSDVTGIHLLSHGDPGDVRLGSTLLNASNVGNYAGSLAAIGEHLSADADLLIYGCNVAQGQAGAQLVNLLAQLTGADVAASADNTGAAAKGGNWQLEAVTGKIDVQTLEAQQFDGLLAAPVNTVPATPVYMNADGSAVLFTGANAISVSDADNNIVSVQLAVSYGVLDVTLASGVTISAGANGSATLTLSGIQVSDFNDTLASLRYTPSAGLNGVDRLLVVTTDFSATQAVSVVEIEGTPGYAEGIHASASASLGEDGALIFSGADRISVNWTSGFEQDGSEVVQLSVDHGSLSTDGVVWTSGSLNRRGSETGLNTWLAQLQYRPQADYNGPDRLRINAVDTSGGSTLYTAELDITVSPVADIVADALTTDTGKAVTANLVTGTNGANADNFEGPAPFISAVTQGAHGSVSFLPDGAVTYTPVAGYAGIDSFTYTVTSPAGVTETGFVAVEVKGAVLPPDPARPWAAAPQPLSRLPSLASTESFERTAQTPLAAPLNRDVAEMADKVFVQNAVRDLPLTMVPSLFVQHAVRDEQLTVIPNVFVQAAVRASQSESALRVAQVAGAAAPEAGSPLFDAFGLSAPRTEFVSPVRQAEKTTAQTDGDSMIATPQKAVSDKAGADRFGEPVEALPKSEIRSLPSAHGAASFTSQLRRDGESLRTAGERSTQREQRISAAREST